MAKKNEAKIQFTASTKEFNEAIKKSNDTMSELRAELKLNETQMKRTGTSVEALEDKHKILSAQLQASEDKTNALNQKVQKAIEIYGENSTEVSKLKVQLLNAQTAEEKVRQAIDNCNRELDEQRNSLSDVGNSFEKMSDKVSRQENELKNLKKQYVDLVAETGETSDEAEKLAREISDLSGELKQNKTSLQQASDKANELDRSLDNVGDSADNAGEGFTIMKGVVADLASSAIQNAIGKISEFIGYLGQLPRETAELRQDMSTLTTAFDNMGFSTDQARNTWKELYKVFGEDDRAVETANHISRISESQEDLNKWVTITTGIWGTYQDSLPVEGLAEASNETAKTGKVTGVLADALNWSSESSKMFAKYLGGDVVTAEDAFNVALSECNTEQERQQLITDTLTSLYGESAETYRETSKAQMEAKEATAENIQAENDLATAIEPVTTAFTELKNEALQSLIPVIEKVSEGMLGALDWAKEHPVALKVFAGVIGVLAVAIGALTAVVVGWTVAQWALNSAILANPITWIIVGIITAITAVVAIIILVIEYWDEIVQAVKNCVDYITEKWGTFVNWLDTSVVQPVKQFFTDLWTGITETASNVWEGVKTAWTNFTTWIQTSIVQPVIGFFQGLWEGVKSAWDMVCNVVQVGIMFIGSILDAGFQLITLPFRFIWENCKDTIISAWNSIKNAVTSAINVVKNIITTGFNAVKNFFTTVWNSIKTTVTSAWNAIVNVVTPIINKIKTVVTTVFNAVKTYINTVLNAIKTTFTTIFNAIKNTVTSVFNAIKTTVTSIFNSVKSFVSSVWNGIKTTITNTVNNIKTKVTSVFNSVKTSVSSVFNGIKSVASNTWNNIKNAITKPIEEAKNKIKSIIDTIKGFFSKLKLKLPDIKLPSFKITGKFSLDPPSVPKLSIKWNADGTIFTRPTIFNTTQGLQGVGEAGPEAVLPIDKLEGYIENVIERTMPVLNMQMLADKIEDLANRPVELNINGRQFAYATASDTDSVNGLRSSFKNRGLVLE